jgi:hypothetical protein
MALFKYIYHCCCKHEKEPEKLPSHSIVEQPKTRNEDKLLFLPDESSIIAAPSPHIIVTVPNFKSKLLKAQQLKLELW